MHIFPGKPVCDFSQNGSTNSDRPRLREALSPSSGGVGRKTGYLGLPTRRVLSRELILGTVRAS